MVRRRPASVQLRQGGAGSPESGAGPDQSNQALGEALRVVYRFLQFGMVALVVVFLFSGLKSVKEGERGIRVAFGEARARDLTPGFHLSLPQPLGDIIKVETGNRPLLEKDQFWPAGSGDARYADDTAQARNSRTNLDPVQDGFLLTGDLGIGHALVEVSYGRDPDKVYQFAEKIHPDAEQRIVQAAVRKGIVHAAASVSIDRFRKDSDSVMQAEALRVAQQSLDDLKAGLQIRSFSVTRRMVPSGLIPRFNEVTAAVNRASSLVSEAEQYRQATLASTAGPAADEALRLIDRYDQQFTSGQKDEAEKTLARVDALLSGGAPVEGKPNTFAGGRAPQLLETARSERARARSRAQGDAAVYASKLAAFRSNPGVVLMGDWSDAFSTFVNRDTVQVFMLPPTMTDVTVLLNRDPQIQKQQEQNAAAREQEQIQKRNFEQLRKSELQANPAPAGG